MHTETETETSTMSVSTSNLAPSTVSIIIPALNEEEALPRTISSCTQQSPSPKDIVVADAGSQDKTQEVARKAGAHVISSGRGRALQMNAGAQNSTGEVLLFLHADTQLPKDALEMMHRTLADSNVLGGCFQLSFDAQSQSRGLQLWSWCTRTWLLRTPRLVFGDRAIFVRRSVFLELGGYREWPLLEDVDFAMRLASHGKDPGSKAFAFLPLAVTTSARRLLEVGPWKQQLINTCIIIAWYLGFTPEALKAWYKYRVAPSSSQNAKKQS
eukprot:TRINITY_DN20114_c2_g1_i1.p1 TRINITY_DN20114_c2_g1~~TRINITY_DN20114_c2_g1_i1.p1  ORF type:complete len:270 (-),score=38.93 TRINITY_DN20114_c2_g1_i1:45-854(-)